MVPATFNPPGHTAENWPVAAVAVWLTMVNWKFPQLDSDGSAVMAAVEIELADTQVPTIDDDDVLVGVAAVTLALDGARVLDVRSTLHAAVKATKAANELISMNERPIFIPIPLSVDGAPTASIERLQMRQCSNTLARAGGVNLRINR